MLVQGLTLDLDSGAIGTGAASDLVYTGPNGMLAPVASGTMMAIWNDTGSAAFDRLTQGNLYRVFNYSSVPLQDTQLQAGIIIVAKTKTGKYSKILIAYDIMSDDRLTAASVKMQSLFDEKLGLKKAGKDKKIAKSDAKSRPERHGD